MKIAAVIFDWAGTMVDFGSLAPVAAMQRAFEAEGVAITAEEVRAGMGLAKRDHVNFILGLPRVAQAWAAQKGPFTQRDTDRIFAAIAPLMREEGELRATLIPGAAETARFLSGCGIRIGSTTGYTREMMGPILEQAAAQGYAPDMVVCAGETPVGRPSPLMIWKTLAELQVWPASAVVKVDDAPVGIAEGRNAGCFTVGIAASGNAMGLDPAQYAALDDSERRIRLTAARTELLAAGADLVIDTVANLPEALGLSRQR